MKVKLKHTRQQTGRKKTQQMNADWPVYHDITDRRRSLVHKLCCVIIELKQNDALKRIKSYQREEEETTEV